MPDSYSHGWQESIDEKIWELRKEVIVGNGRLPLTQRVSTLEDRVKDILEREAKKDWKQARIEAGIWIGVILMILTLLSQHLK